MIRARVLELAPRVPRVGHRDVAVRGLPARTDPLEAWADAIEWAGLEVARREPGFPEGRPNRGEPDHAEIVGCGIRQDRPIGVSVSIGQVEDTVAVATEVGGPPATSGCSS